MPAHYHTRENPRGYDIYPTHDISGDTIDSGFAALARHITGHAAIVIDGYVGVFWEQFRQQLTVALHAHNIDATWHNAADAMLPESEIDRLVAPFTGGDDPIFGTRTTLSLRDLFDAEKLASIRSNENDTPTIIYGCGAALADIPDAFIIYVDLPKNEIQYRSRANTAWNLGQSAAESSPKDAYKRYYFVDWVLLNRHKARLTASLDLIVDAQQPAAPTMMTGDTFRTALDELTRTPFRVRPWFEPGTWGGQWMKQHIDGLAQDVPNYAWSFEMIAPEQGIVFKHGDHLLEASFDFLMYHAHDAVLGRYAEYFGYEFPVRFDFLDTIQGGNLSVQCHPRPDFIRQQFGEHFTQDETYYILECEPDAVVYLGFQDDVDPQDFRQALEHSHRTGAAVDIPRFVQVHPAKKGDLFLIPHGTIHASGTGNLVLEISATPYIFTFKMYDWLRLDLDGKPRPINIERAFDNVNFHRRGHKVADELLSQPRIIEENDDHRIIKLPTHPAHFYEIERLEVTSGVTVPTHESVQILMVVEGQSIRVQTGDIVRQYHYAETFIIPANANEFRLINEHDNEVKIIRAFMKADWFTEERNQWLSSPWTLAEAP